MAAAQELLVDLRVAGLAVGGRHPPGDFKAVMVLLLLTRGGLVTVQAVDVLRGVGAHLVLVNDRVLLRRVAFGALARCADRRRGGLLDVGLWAGAVDEKRANDERKRDDDRDEDRAEGHPIYFSADLGLWSPRR